MADIIKIKKGLDIPLPGAASTTHTTDTITCRFAIIPDDFPGHKWKCAVKTGDNVLIGSPLLFSKDCEAVKLTSPVSGTVEEIRRGQRRKIEAVVIKASTPGGIPSQGDFLPFIQENDLNSLPTDPAHILEILCESGLMAMIRQRPFDIIPDPAIAPRDIFVTAFDSAPLAPSLIEPSMMQMHETGLKMLAALTHGRVYLGIPYDSQITSKVANVYEFEGPHPAGNAGVQIAKISPVNRGQTVWTLDSRTVVRIGALFTTGHLDTQAQVAICGDKASDPHIIETRIGAALETLLKGEYNHDQKDHLRIISGNVLTGVKVNPDNGFLHFPYRQVTIIEEGDNADEFMGWASISPSHYSVKRSFPAFLLGKRGKYKFDSRLRGGKRAMILSGEMDKVFPMDIYPEFLLKAIMAFDIEKMEQLGIYEVAPEDFALPEFVDTSKQPLQQIVRDGLDKLRAELS